MTTPDIAEPEVESAGTGELAEARPFQFSAASALTPGRQESLESWHRNLLKLASASLVSKSTIPCAAASGSAQPISFKRLAT